MNETGDPAAPPIDAPVDLETQLDEALAWLQSGAMDLDETLGLLASDEPAGDIRALVALAGALEELADLPRPADAFRQRLALQIATAPVPSTLAHAAAATTSDLVQALDQSIALVQSGYADVETALAQVPQSAAELEPLVALAAALDALPALPGPSPEFQSQLARRLKSAPLPRALRRRQTPLSWLQNLSGRLWRSTAFMAAVSAAVLLFIGTGATYASANALPGQPLYPVKRGVEAVSVWLAGVETAMQLHLDFAGRRLAEALDAPQSAGMMLAEFSREVTAALVDADQALSAGLPRGRIVPPLLTWLIGARGDLVSARPALPPTAWRAALALVDEAIAALQSGKTLAVAPIPRLTDPDLLMDRIAWGSLTAPMPASVELVWTVAGAGGAGSRPPGAGSGAIASRSVRPGGAAAGDGPGGSAEGAGRGLGHRTEGAGLGAASGSGRSATGSNGSTGSPRLAALPPARPGAGGGRGSVEPGPGSPPGVGGGQGGGGAQPPGPQPTDVPPGEPQPGNPSPGNSPKPKPTSKPGPTIAPSQPTPGVTAPPPPPASPLPTAVGPGIEPTATTAAPVPTIAPPPSPTAVNSAPIFVTEPKCDPARIELHSSTVCTAEASDPDVDPITYQWSLPDVTAGYLNNTDSSVAEYVAEASMSGLGKRIITLEITITDGHHDPLKLTTTVTVVPYLAGTRP